MNILTEYYSVKSWKKLAILLSCKYFSQSEEFLTDYDYSSSIYNKDNDIQVIFQIFDEYNITKNIEFKKNLYSCS